MHLSGKVYQELTVENIEAIIMGRIFSMSMEIIAAFVILIPILFLYHRMFFHNGKKTLAYIIFMLYLATMCLLVGFPNIAGIKMVFSFNFIPLKGMLSDITSSYLNVLLFIPLGALVPCLWSKYRSIMKVTALGFVTSLGIEVLQIFTLRATDVNDLITNVAGTVIGYLVSRVFIKKIPQLDSLGTKEGELYLLYGTVAVVMFFIQPFMLLLSLQKIA